MEKNEVPLDQFYCAVGRALTSWWLVERGLGDIFARLVITPITGTMRNVPASSLKVMQVIFQTSSNLRSRISMISDIIDISIDDQSIKDEWITIKNRVNDLYKRRNTLAHGAVFGDHTGADAIINDIHSERPKIFNFTQVCACDRSFRKIADRATALAGRINEHLATKRH